MTQPVDPPRLVHRLDTPPLLRNLLADAHATAHDPAVVERLVTSVEARMAMAAPAAGAVWLARALPWGTAAIALMVGGVAAWSVANTHGPTRAIHWDVREAVAATVTSVAAPIPTTEAPPVTSVAPVSVASERHAPVVRRTPEPAAADEYRLVRAARDALEADPNAALRKTEEHRRIYPQGVLAQEREAIAIEALAHLGRRSEAQSRGSAFLRAYPRSPHRARVEAAMGRSR